MNGVLVIDKPKGPTSFDVVYKVRRALGVPKVGHTGTLDPMATGVLPLCLGEATKISSFILESRKVYQATVALGSETDTWDAEGKEVTSASVPALSRDSLESALNSFRGQFKQVPPMYSAIKVQGKRLYELARQGKEIPREPRSVEVFSLELVDFSSDSVQLRMECSKGFFVRSLAHDLAIALGTVGHLRELRRTRTGPFTLEQAWSLEDFLLEVQTSGPAVVDSKLIKPADALQELPAWTASAALAKKVMVGFPLEVSLADGICRVLNEAGDLLAVGEVTGGKLSYRRVMGPPPESLAESPPEHGSSLS